MTHLHIILTALAVLILSSCTKKDDIDPKMKILLMRQVYNHMK